MKQRFHLIPSEREKKCLHLHMPYSGRIPCTGPRRCTMCGLTEDQINEELIATDENERRNALEH
jgi:hypothetical protein